MKNKALYTFRRNQLHVEDICKRIIQHGLENLEDQECVKRIFRILIHLLEYIVKLVGEQEGHNLKAKENGARQKIFWVRKIRIKSGGLFRPSEPTKTLFFSSK